MFEGAIITFEVEIVRILEVSEFFIIRALAFTESEVS